MTWEQIKTWLDQFTDKPIVYYTLCVVIGIIAAFVLFSKISVGRKALNELRGLFSRNEQTAKDTLKKVQDVETLAKDEIASQKAFYEAKAEDLKADYEAKLSGLVSVVNFYETSIFTILEDIPNAKVQAKLKAFKEDYESKKENILTLVSDLYLDFDSVLEEQKKAIRNEYDEKIAYLENQIAQINLYFSEVKEEGSNGEREEGTNTDSAKEEIQEN